MQNLFIRTRSHASKSSSLLTILRTKQVVLASEVPQDGLGLHQLSLSVNGIGEIREGQTERLLDLKTTGRSHTLYCKCDGVTQSHTRDRIKRWLRHVCSPSTTPPDYTPAHHPVRRTHPPKACLCMHTGTCTLHRSTNGPQANERCESRTPQHQYITEGQHC